MGWREYTVPSGMLYEVHASWEDDLHQMVHITALLSIIAHEYYHKIYVWRRGFRVKWDNLEQLVAFKSRLFIEPREDYAHQGGLITPNANLFAISLES